MSLRPNAHRSNAKFLRWLRESCIVVGSAAVHAIACSPPPFQQRQMGHRATAMLHLQSGDARLLPHDQRTGVNVPIYKYRDLFCTAVVRSSHGRCAKFTRPLRPCALSQKASKNICQAPNQEHPSNAVKLNLIDLPLLHLDICTNELC